jgi:hypothetical protein
VYKDIQFCTKCKENNLYSTVVLLYATNEQLFVATGSGVQHRYLFWGENSRLKWASSSLFSFMNTDLPPRNSGITALIKTEELCKTATDNSQNTRPLGWSTSLHSCLPFQTLSGFCQVSWQPWTHPAHLNNQLKCAAKTGPVFVIIQSE